MTNMLGILRPIADEEVELMRSWRNHPATRANMYTRHEISRDEHASWWRKTKDRADQRYFMYETEGCPLGITALSAIDPANRNASWAFYASPSAPKGTGSKMEFLMLEHVFGELQLHKLSCEVLAFNQPVIALHHKFGFQTEGIFRQHHLVESAFVDVHRLAILAHEWQAVREATIQKLTSYASP